MDSFPSTCWSRFDVASTGPEARAAVAELARHYWAPLHGYIRARWGRSAEDATDLTQDFFAWMIESGFLFKADARRGRFRVFVKGALEHFVLNEVRDAARLKRGGDRFQVPIEDIPEATATTQKTPDRILDELWRNGLLVRAQAGLDEALRGEKREITLKVFRDYCLPESAGVSYKDLATRHGVSEGDVLVHLRHARKRFREILTSLVSETVRSPGDLAEELKALFGEETP